MAVIDRVEGRIVDYDERTQELVIRAKYDNAPTLMRRDYKSCVVQLNDSRKLSDQQRRCCYALIAAIADYAGDDRHEVKELLKFRFWTEELYETADSMFSLSNAPMSVVAAFQKFLARFCINNDVPTKKPLIEYCDDVADYVYASVCAKKCVCCGKRAELHHVDRVGMGRNRDDIIHEGMQVLSLCREHHTEAHTMPDSEFFDKWHLVSVEADKTVCKLYHIHPKGAARNGNKR